MVIGLESFLILAILVSNSLRCGQFGLFKQSSLISLTIRLKINLKIWLHITAKISLRPEDEQ